MSKLKISAALLVIGATSLADSSFPVLLSVAAEPMAQVSGALQWRSDRRCYRAPRYAEPMATALIPFRRRAWRRSATEAADL